MIGREGGTFSEQRQRRTLECLQDKLNCLPRCVGDTSGTRERLLSMKNKPWLIASKKSVSFVTTFV